MRELARSDPVRPRTRWTRRLDELVWPRPSDPADTFTTPKQKQWALIRAHSLRLLGKATPEGEHENESELTEVELWPEEGEKRSEFMDRCVVELEKCIGDRAEEVCDEKWHQSRKLGKKGFVTVKLRGDLAIEPCGKTCLGCEGAPAPFDKAGTKRPDSADLLNPFKGLHDGHDYDHRKRRRAREVAERLDSARAQDRRGRDGAASEADGGGSDRSLPSWRDVGRDVARFDPSEPRDEQGRWTDGGGSGGTAADDAGSSPVEFQELKSANTKRFHDAISAAKAADKFGASVHAYEPDEYRNMRMFVTDGGKIGFALKADGDIVSAFKHPDSKVKQAANAMLALATKNGGNKLDAFDTVLPRIYSESGFRAVARLAWNDQFAPPGWDKATYAKFNNGKPDVVFMVHDPAHAQAYKPGDGPPVATYEEGVVAQTRALEEIAHGDEAGKWTEAVGSDDDLGSMALGGEDRFKTPSTRKVDALRDEMGITEADVPFEQRQALDMYTADSTAFNQHARGGPGAVSAETEHLDKLAGSYKLPSDVTVYRTVGWQRTKSIMNHVGDSFSDPGFMSTTLDKSKIDKPGSYIEIQIPKDSHAFPVGSLSNYPEEAEILFPRNSRLQIISHEPRDAPNTERFVARLVS